MSPIASRRSKVFRFVFLIGFAASLMSNGAPARPDQVPPPAVTPSDSGQAGRNQPGAQARPGTAIKTPLPQALLTLISNEVSGQMAFNNLMRLAGAPWVRSVQELRETMSETIELERLVRSFGLTTVEAATYPPAKPEATFDYPMEGELWTLEPEKRLLARIGADAALISRGSKTADVSGELIYVPALTPEEAKTMCEAGPTESTRGKLALVWGLNADMTTALDAAGIVAVITFNAQDRYLDPDQVIYSGVSLDQARNLKLGLAVSWRQWSELLEDVELNRRVVLRASARVEKFPDRFEMIHAWIPGTEPDKKGVIFTSHLYEGYLKRGANDSMGGVAVQLEILRTLHRLIGTGTLPRPRRAIHFLWPNEISGTNEFIKHNPDLVDKLSININMDMVSEALRKNNSWLTLSECPGHLPSFYDGLAAAVMNYVWRTNDIVYLNDGPRGRYRGQNFPVPLGEKNGSRDAFRFYIHKATGGSDHVCFVAPAVAVPAVELFTWPDQWYHTDTDTPDKADPTEMKRVAFIGAATGWVAAALDDAWAADLADSASAFGYRRVAERDLPRAFARLDKAEAGSLASETDRALNLVRFAAKREMGAIGSIDEISTGSAAAKAAVAARLKQWELYAAALKNQVLGYAAVRAKTLGKPAPSAPRAASGKDALRIPAISPAVRGKELSLARFEPYAKYLKDHPDTAKMVQEMGPSASMLLNFVNGRNTVAEVAADAAAELDMDIPLDRALAYLRILAETGYIVLER